MTDIKLPTPVLFDILRPQLVAKRQELQISPQTLALDLRVSSYQLSQWEAGTSLDISDETLRRWAALLDLPLYPYQTQYLALALENFGIPAQDVPHLITSLQKIRHAKRVTTIAITPMTYYEYQQKKAEETP